MELTAAYPEAKVVLVERDIDSCHQSYSTTVATVGFRKGFFSTLVGLLHPARANQRKQLGRMLSTIKGGANSKEEVLQRICDTYRGQYAESGPQPRLARFEYRLGDGRGRLCEFLGNPVPDVSFPHKNDWAEFREKARAVEERMTATIRRRLGLGLLGLFGGVRAVWAMKS
jgi:hypothetical protein